MGQVPGKLRAYNRAVAAALLFLCPWLWRAHGEPPQGDAELTVEVRERESGKPVPARFYLKDEKGAPQTPAGVISYSKGEENHFIAARGFTIRLSEGGYTLTVERGPEYRSQSFTIALRAGQAFRQTVLMDRWIDREIRFHQESGDFKSVDDRNEMLYFFKKARRIYSVLARSPES